MISQVFSGSIMDMGLLQLSDALIRLENITGFKPVKSGKIYSALCPCHDDNTCSLIIAKGKRYPIVATCHAGCEFSDIIQALIGNIPLPKRTVKIETTPFWKRKIEKTYTYTDANGHKLYQKVRFEGKSFAVRRFQNNSFKWGLGKIKPVLYNLPSVIASSEVFIVEGEKNADILIGLGLVATCNLYGAGEWLKTYNECLTGKAIYIIPDNDLAGEKHAQLVKDNVDGKIIELGGLAYKQDVWDWVTLGNTKQELLNLC